MKKRRILALIVACAAILSSLVLLASCKKDKRVPIGMLVNYIGEPVVSTDYQFSREEFTVQANFEDGSSEVLTDFDFEVESLEQGYYTLIFSYNGYETSVYIKCEVPIYPSDKK